MKPINAQAAAGLTTDERSARIFIGDLPCGTGNDGAG